MKNITGKLMMAFPIQVFASHVAQHAGVELGSPTWFLFVAASGALFMVGHDMARA